MELFLKKPGNNHNDLLPWFTEDHGQLPASYLKSTKNFFDGLRFSSDRRKPQATSGKRQASATIGKYNKK